MVRKQKCKEFLYALLTLFLLLIIIIGGRGVFPAFAETTSYTSALEDLQKDSTFQVSSYPYNANDYNIKVIQIAEGERGELYLYTYQPCQMTKYLIATSINMSLSIDDNADNNQGAGGNTDNDNADNNQGSSDTVKPGTGGAVGGGFGGGGGSGRSAVRSTSNAKLYRLTLINTSGVFGKYMVDDFTVSKDTVRYYNITSIYRQYDATIDKDTGNDNTIDEVVYEVGQLWTVTTSNNEVTYNMTYIETITVTDKYVGFLRYSNGFKLYNTACDSHYIAFSTDRQMDKLLEADVSYVYRYCELTYLFGMETNSRYNSPIKKDITLTYDQKSSNAADGWFATKYTWNRIESVSAFTASEDLTTEAKAELKNKQWVLRFAETDYTATHNVTALTGEQFYEVTEVTILRLKFETAGKTYNLGVVDNKQSGDTTPDNVQKVNDFWSYIWNCIVKLFTGQASTVETVVAVIVMAVALFVFAIAIAYIKLIYKLIFK